MDYQLEDPFVAGGVFPGVRLFNMDSEGFDPVPWITALVNFQHAKCEAAGFWRNVSAVLAVDELCQTKKLEGSW